MSGNRSDINGFGKFKVIEIPMPAAQKDWEVTIPSNEIWDVQSIRFNLNCDANVGDRDVRIDYPIIDGVPIFRIFTEARLTASQQERLEFSKLYQSYVIPSGKKPFGNQNFAIPEMLIDGSLGVVKITSDTNTLQVTDQYNNIRIYVRFWTT